MSWYVFHSISNLSVAVPAMAVFFVTRPARAYYPFIALLWLGAVNEVLSWCLVFTIRTNAVNGNLYVLAEYGLLLWQFCRWNRWPARIFAWFALPGLALWAADNLALHSLSDNNSVFRAGYAFLVVLLSIDRVNRLVIYEKARLIKNASFWICTGFLLYYCIKAFAEVFNAFPLHLPGHFYMVLWSLLSFINLIANIIFTKAVLWIPRKSELILHY